MAVPGRPPFPPPVRARNLTDLPAPASGLVAGLFVSNESGEPVDFLMLFTPGAAREGYFEGVGHLAGMSDEERLAFFAHHDSHFTDMAKGPAAQSWQTRGPR